MSGEDLFLQPGMLWFGDGIRTVGTLLGSCVAVALWHPRHRHGGMCHFLLPKRARREGGLDPRYGDEAIELMCRAAAHRGHRLSEYRVGLYGGGSTMSAVDPQLAIGALNVALARRLLAQHGCVINHDHTGLQASRRVSLDLQNGAVQLRVLPLNQKGKP